MKSIFKGKIFKKFYYTEQLTGGHGEYKYLIRPYITEKSEFVEWKVIKETDKLGKILKNDDPIVIDDKIYYVKMWSYDSDGNVVYFLDTVLEVIEDEETESSRIFAERELEKKMVKYEQYLESLDKDRITFEKDKQKKNKIKEFFMRIFN